VRVKWTRCALREQDAAFEWLVARNPRAAVQAIDRLWNATQLLAENPKMGRPGLISGTRELVVGHIPYIVIYQVTVEQVEILAVLHRKQERPTRL